jgi:integrase
MNTLTDCSDTTTLCPRNPTPSANGTPPLASVDLPYLETFRARGTLVAYYRRDGRRRRLRDEAGRPVGPSDAPALIEAWKRAHAEHEAADEAAASAGKARAVRPGSLADLIKHYRADPAAYGQLKPATKADYEKGLRPLEADWGHLLAVGVRRSHVAAIRNRYAKRLLSVKGSITGERVEVSNARQANRIVTTLSILLSYAVDPLEWRTDNPALRPKRLRTEGEGFRPWKPAEFMQFWERSDAEWRFNVLFGLLSGQRGQDQVAMLWTDYDGTSLYVEQQKGRGRVKIWVECHPMLLEALDARRAALAGRTPVPLTILARLDGKPWKVNAFQKAAGKAIRAAGLDGIVWHGLRGSAASWAAEGGASEKMIQALLGHLTPAASQHYARGAEQRRLAAAAVRLIIMPFGDGKKE